MPTNKQITQGIYEAFSKGDVPSVLAVMDDKIEWTEAEGFPLYDGTFVGPQAVLEGVFMRLGEIGDDFTVTPNRFVAEGDTVVTIGTYSWKHRSTGEPAKVQMAHVLTFRDGKLISFEQLVDTLKVQERSA
jgi:ketosteroid isomerase-like protein